MPVLLLAALLASAAPPRLLVVSPEAELRRATVASLASETSISLSPTLEGAAACGDVGCARQQALGVNADFVLIVRRTTDGASLRLLDTAEGFVVGARDVVAPDAMTLGAALGADARALMRIARPEPPPPDPPPVEAPAPEVEAPRDIAPPPPPGEPPPAPRPEQRPEQRPEGDGWGAVGVTIGAILGIVAIGAAACFGLSIAANGCDSASADCGNACAGALACGALAGACVADAPAACDTAVDVCDTGVDVCSTGLACLNACNGLARPSDDDPETLIGPPDGAGDLLAMAY